MTGGHDNLKHLMPNKTHRHYWARHRLDRIKKEQQQNNNKPKTTTPCNNLGE